MDSDALFFVTNKHSPSSGEPPQIDANTPNRYHSYFENAQGEQLIFVFDYAKNEALLYHGDAGWEHPQPVHDGITPNVVLDEAERLWLRACWMAATEGRGLS